MNPKIEKLRMELQKNKSKITELQSKNRELEKQICELEDTDIVGMVRERGLSPEQLMQMLLGAPVHKNKKEEPHYEKEP